MHRFGSAARLSVVALGLAMLSSPVSASAPKVPPPAKDLVDMEMMTAFEVRDALAHGKTTALVFNGGTETRGPQAVNGGHTLVARSKADAIARKLGNALAAPVLPFSPNNATPELPGTIGITADTFKEINKEVAEQLIRNGFKNVVLMGDHGGGQKQLAEVATELDAKYASQGIRVVYCEDAYKRSNADYDKYLEDHGFAPGGHASINDTSEMMYAEPAPDAWVRRDMLPQAVGTTQPSHTNYAGAQGKTGSQTADGKPAPSFTHSANGVSGDGRRSSAELGKIGYDMHVDESVAQIRQLLSTPPAGTQ